MTAQTTSLGNQMYSESGARVSTFGSGQSSSARYVIAPNSMAVAAGKVLRGADISGSLRDMLPGSTVTVTWLGHVAVVGAPTPAAGGRVNIPFALTIPPVSRPLYELKSPISYYDGMRVTVQAPSGVPASTIPSSATVIVDRSVVYFSDRPGFQVTAPSVVPTGEYREMAVTVQYRDGEAAEGVAVTVRNATRAVAVAATPSAFRDEVVVSTNSQGVATFHLWGLKPEGDALSVFIATPSLTSPPLSITHPMNGAGVTSDGCTIVPAVPAAAPVPGYETRTPQLGWNSGARSETVITGDARLTFSVGVVNGVVVGLRPSGSAAPSGAISDATHGFYMYTGNGRVRQFQVIESGERIGDAWTYLDTAVFSIVRVENRVQYSVSGEGQTLFQYASAAPLAGDTPIEVVASLYASNDKVE